MPSDLLNLLVAASRPFIPFSATINGQVFEFKARKLSLAESQVVSDVWDEVYSETRAKYDDTAVDTAPIFAQIKRLDTKALSKYVAEADRFDLRQEASALNDNKPFDDPEVVEATDCMVAQRREELAVMPLEELRRLAMDRRAHFYASNMASEASARKTATLIIHTPDQKPYFDSIEEAAMLQFDDLLSIITEANKAIAGVAVKNPLSLADKELSEKPEPSLKTSEGA